MFEAIHLPNNLTGLGFGVSDSRCLPTSTLCSHSLCAGHKTKSRPLHCTLLGASFMCKARTGGHRRNPDLSNQNRHGFSRSRNTQNDSLQNLDQSHLLPSKNGALLPLSSTPKSEAAATPGPREKEIVQLFRKVQAQLRERAATKEEQKVEAKVETKGGQTVDSLLKLLRKHSQERGKRSKDFSFNHVNQNSPYDEDEEKGTSIVSLRDKAPQPTGPSSSRPISKFQRKSPVPRMKHHPIYAGERIVDSTQTKPKVWTQHESEREAWEELQSQGETEMEPHPESYELEHEPDEIGAVFQDIVENSDKFVKHQDHEDLNSLKLAELRAIAKSRGMKGFSKRKKSELLQLLSTIQV